MSDTTNPSVNAPPTGLCSAHRDGELGCLTCYPPSYLWQIAEGDAERYRALMEEHGHIVLKGRDDKLRTPSARRWCSRG